MTEARILYYAFGGGLGHVTRALSLARQLARLVPARHLILFNSPFEMTLRRGIEREGGIGWRHLSSHETPASARRFVAEAVVTFRPDVLIVDTFPRGLGGEFASLFAGWWPRLNVLISRHLPRSYVRGFQLHRFVASHFDLVVVPGEPSPFGDAVCALRTDPFLMRDADELPPRKHAAGLVFTKPAQPVVLLIAGGTLAECQELVTLGDALAATWHEGLPPMRLALPEEIPVPHIDGRCRIVRRFPLLDCLPAAAFVIASGGYNTVHETRAAQVPALFIARRRKYDDQFLRIRDTVCQWDSTQVSWAGILQSCRTPMRAARFQNGAGTAASRIASLIDGGERRRARRDLLRGV